MKICEICGRPVTGRHGKAILCLECVRSGMTVYTVRRQQYKDRQHYGGAAFKDCEDCRTCAKTDCRHNPKNPGRIGAAAGE